MEKISKIAMNHVLFISDLHLQESFPERTEMFLEFLKTTALKAKELYILGDLFEAWIGDDVDTEFNRTVQSALKQFTASGIPVYLMPGNRDFLLGEKFAKNTGVTIFDDPSEICLYARPTLLTHGDILCTNDRSLMWFRKFSHAPILQKCFLILPVSLRKFLAQKIRAKSKKDALLKTDEVKGIVNSTVLDLMHKYKLNQIVHGHVHMPAIHEIKTENFTGRRIVLGAWDKSPNYVIYYKNHEVKIM